MKMINLGMFPNMEIGDVFFAIILTSKGESYAIILIVEHPKTTH